MKISIPWTKKADTHGALPLKGLTSTPGEVTQKVLYADETRPTSEWDHTAQLDLDEAEETLGELRRMWEQEKARRDEQRAVDG